jgi:hypothetical protein
METAIALRLILVLSVLCVVIVVVALIVDFRKRR